jgi:hypothetical protein
MLTICEQNLGVTPLRRKFSRLNVLFIVMFTFAMVQPWDIGSFSRIQTAFNLVNIHLLFRIMLLIQ